MAANRMSRLDAFIGTWNTTGEVLETEANPAGALVATDTYRWLPGKHFIVHDVDARFDGIPTRSMEVMGFDRSKKRFFARSYDDQGSTEAFVVDLDGRRWTNPGQEDAIQRQLRLPKESSGRLVGTQGQGRLAAVDQARIGAGMKKLISSGSPFEEQMAYSRAVVDGEWVFVSGTTGFDYARMTISQDVAEQAEQCMRNIAHALQQAGASLADVVRVTYILPDAADFEPCWPVMRKYLGDVRPAATMLSAGLLDPRMKIEIQVTARKRGSS